MANYCGTDWKKDELRARCGQMAQVAGIAHYELQEGDERGVEICDFRTGSGFGFQVCPSRGLDITFAQHNGRPLCWSSSTGVLHPHTFNDSNLGWLRGFYGGLLATCGFGNFGSPCEDEGEHYGIHDRASYLPARHVNISEEWIQEDGSDHYELSVEGALRQTRVFGPNIVLRRRISARLGESTLRVQDTAINEGFTSTPFVVLYHCNFGFPVVSEHSVVRAPSTHCEPRDDFAAQTAATWDKLEAPQPGIAERCYFHTMKPDENGKVQAEIWNEHLRFGAFVRYRFDQLPFFTQWKTMDAGTYVNGLEPSNAPLKPRNELREAGELPLLEPGEERRFELELGIL